MKQGNKKGFSLMETLVTLVIVGMMSAVCGTMLIFAYSMFEKVMGSGTASIEYKTFRFRTEKIFRNMTKAGPVIQDLITDDLCSRENRPPFTPAEEESCIKMDVDYIPLPYSGRFDTRKYYQSVSGNATTKYRITTTNASGVTSIDIDEGIWQGYVGRTVSVYSCVENEKIDSNYKRYLMTVESSTETAKKMVVLYSWNVVLTGNGEFTEINASNQDTVYRKEYAQREVLLHDVMDFQVTNRLSNLATNRIILDKYANTAVVRLFVKLGEDSEAQYSNDFIFANKSMYGNVDNFFTGINESNVVP